MRPALLLLAFVASGSGLCAAPPVGEGDGATDARVGLVVYVGCGSGAFTNGLSVERACLVHGLDTDAAIVAATRARVHAQGLYGRVIADRFDGRHLPYGENAVNLLIVERSGGVTTDELMRVLAPLGELRVRSGNGWQKTVKPWPGDIDEWPQFLYEPGNNALSKDLVAGPPQRVQWINGPRWSRHHESCDTTAAMVSAAGRLFVIYDLGPIGIRTGDVASRTVLQAFDAFSGVLLWDRPVAWAVANNRVGSHNYDRMLAAQGQRVFVAPGDGQSILCLDGASGRVIREFPGSEHADEILLCDNTLLAAIPVGKAERQKDRNRVVKALALDSGRTMWTSPPFTGMYAKTLACQAGRVCVLAGKEQICLELSSGRELWRTAHRLQPLPERTRLWSNPALLIAGGEVFSTAGGLMACDLSDGRYLWEVPVHSRYAEHDLYFRDSLLWRLPSTSWASGYKGETLDGLDMRTGEVARQIGLRELFEGTEHHSRCYRSKATARYLFTSQRGVETVPWDPSGGIALHPWVRGSCRYGILPANGLLYAPPQPCACNIHTKLAGFYALAPAPRQDVQSRAPGASPADFEKGPAWGWAGDAGTNGTAWLTYRGDMRRSGVTTARLGPNLKLEWEANVGGRLTPLTASDDTVYVGSGDRCVVTALDAATGAVRWSYTPGGPLDTPPTLSHGLALFGCRDGSVYAVRASDGALVWRRRLAPWPQRLLVVDGRLESAWPVHGGVLVWHDAAYALAGRQTYLDDGMLLAALDIRTGDVKATTRLSTPPVQKNSVGHPGGLADVLCADDTTLYVGNYAFAVGLAPTKEKKPHLLASSGMLDDSWFNRTGWTIADRVRGGESPSYDPDRIGQNLVDDGTRLYGVKAFASESRVSQYVPGKDSYRIFCIVRDGKPRKAGYAIKPDPRVFVWHRQTPVRANALVKAGDHLILAGAVDVPGNGNPEASLGGRSGARVEMVDADSGKDVAQLTLDAPPVFNGVAVRPGRIFIACMDGKLRAVTAR